ncbi:diguanylate cyclase [Thiomicrorhabdus sp. zzn3]|uniref:sensor domain-containing diguanylate cyclase n=1 Tax=Thiomicrorhabdus sp. zzn3 TaxID=3039775 RepID=UPI002436DE41|nr:diguanylate cyclase [Thiomicrorhabdus sp. zzn3]MDG6777179.1 diguanylate cyclase [Thiomicrorhabdus sp. zzn3]
MKVKKLAAFLLMILVVTLGVVWTLYDYAAQKLEHESILVQQQQTGEKIQSLMERQKHASMTLALSLGNNPMIETLLQGSDVRLEQDLSKLIRRINLQDGFQGAWVQLIDRQGVSRYRSWTQKVGDNLANIRSEVAELLAQPQTRQTISVGRFTLSFKSIIPVMDQQHQLLGLVEVISQFTPLTMDLLSESGIDSLLLTDKRFRNQLTRSVTKQFMDGYYVTNEDVKPGILQLVKRLGVENLIAAKDYVSAPPYIVSHFDVYDEQGQVLAHWLTFTHRKNIDFAAATWVLQKYLIISVGAMLLVLLLFTILAGKIDSDRKKRYYRQIIDSVSDIIYISNRDRIVDVNVHFFRFFDEFSNLKGFLQKYSCVCDTFVEEEGYLAPRMDGVFWLDYVLQHPEKRHKAKIVRHSKTHVFLFKVRSMQGLRETLYNVTMQDITQLETYEEELKKLSVTDELTGAGNRLACKQSLEREIVRGRRYRQAFSVILYDIDHFKHINDEYGHDVGDKVLVTLTETVQGMLREADLLCRYGGEEFLVLLPETGLHEAQQIAERLRERIETLESIEVPVKVTVSFGVAQLTKWDTEFTLLKRVDIALYRAKENGRNRVEVAEEQLQ